METRYTDREWSDEEIAAFEDAIMAHGAELRPVRDEVGSRSMPEVVRFYGHWKKYVSSLCIIYRDLNCIFSSKLGEENARIKAARSSGMIHHSRPSSPISSEDEGSVVKDLSKGITSCGACRTRESDVWWKAPKGLPSNVLCDNCGISWRKYADLNVRPVREEAMAKAKNGEKREGTPLNGPYAKRAKVGCHCII